MPASSPNKDLPRTQESQVIGHPKLDKDWRGGFHAWKLGALVMSNKDIRDMSPFTMESIGILEDISWPSQSPGSQAWLLPPYHHDQLGVMMKGVLGLNTVSGPELATRDSVLLQCSPSCPQSQGISLQDPATKYRSQGTCSKL